MWSEFDEAEDSPEELPPGELQRLACLIVLAIFAGCLLAPVFRMFR